MFETALNESSKKWLSFFESGSGQIRQLDSCKKSSHFFIGKSILWFKYVGLYKICCSHGACSKWLQLLWLLWFSVHKLTIFGECFALCLALVVLILFQNKSTLRAVYIAPPSPKSKTIRTGKLVRFNEDVRVRVIHRDPIEDVSLQVWLSSISENNSNKVDEESDSDVSLSSSPPRKLHRSSSPPLQEKKQASSPNFFFFESSIFKAFETHSAGAVRCR